MLRLQLGQVVGVESSGIVDHLLYLVVVESNLLELFLGPSLFLGGNLLVFRRLLLIRIVFLEELRLRNLLSVV